MYVQPLLAMLSQPALGQGFRSISAVSPGIAAWGLVTGVAMIKSGLSIPLALCMSLTVFAGSAQLAALPLIAVNAPLWVICTTAFCVNLRFVIFSAHMRPYMVRLAFARRLFLGYLTTDWAYVSFVQRYPTPAPTNTPAHIEQTSFFLGSTVANWIVWQVPSIIGIFLADSIAAHWGLGFAGVLALLGLLCQLLRDWAAWLAALAAAAVAIMTHHLPLRINIVLAIVAAVSIGLLIEQFIARKTPLNKATVAHE